MAVSARASQAGKSFSEAFSAGLSAALAPRLTRVVFHAGTAMAPTLNGSSSAAAAAVAPAARKRAAAAAAVAAASAASAAATATAATGMTTKTPLPLPPVEGLLVRVLTNPDAASVRVGDVVAFSAPAVSSAERAAVGAWPSEGQASVLVRRVAASEGEELLVEEEEEEEEDDEKEGTSSSSSSPSEPKGQKRQKRQMQTSHSSTYSVPRGHCWVLADNELLPAAAARDSRAFGPLPYAAVLGRVVYAAASISDHRPIPGGGGGGSGGAGAGGNGAFDEALLEAELDVGELAPPAPVA